MGFIYLSVSLLFEWIGILSAGVCILSGFFVFFMVE